MVDAAAPLQLGFPAQCNQAHYLIQPCVNASAAGTQPGRVEENSTETQAVERGGRILSKKMLQALGRTVHTKQPLPKGPVLMHDEAWRQEGELGMRAEGNQQP